VQWQLGQTKQRERQSDGAGGEQTTRQHLPRPDGKRGAAALTLVAAHEETANLRRSVGRRWPAQLSVAATVPVKYHRAAGGTACCAADWTSSRSNFGSGRLFLRPGLDVDVTSNDFLAAPRLTSHLTNRGARSGACPCTPRITFFSLLSCEHGVVDRRPRPQGRSGHQRVCTARNRLCDGPNPACNFATPQRAGSDQPCDPSNNVLRNRNTSDSASPSPAAR